MGFGPVAPLARIPGPEKVGRYSIGLLAKTRATAKGKGARRPAPKPVREIPILPIAVGSVLVLVAIAIVLYSALNPPGPSKGNVRCDTNEQLAYHIHAHLSILNGDQGEVSVPANIGIRDACLYWLHTHDDTGVIHIEAPSDQASRAFTLGDFFQVWGQPLDSTHVATLTLKSDQKLVVFVDGKSYDKDPRTVPLKKYTQVVLEITPPTVEPPPSYKFASNL